MTPTRSRPGADPEAAPTSQGVLDPVLAAAVDLARSAAQADAGPAAVGDHVQVHPEPGGAATHLFHAVEPGYSGWRWAVTVATCGPGEPITVSEVVLLPGPEALVAPDWLPWHRRVRAGDLGPGDLLPIGPDDPRLVPGYVGSDDPDLEEHAAELGLGRRRVMSRVGRVEAAERWRDGPFGPVTDMARQAPAHCGTCGFFLPVAGSLRAAFGVCGNEYAPADGHVVHVEYGCGAHSEAEIESVSPVPIAEVVYDDGTVEVLPAQRPGPTEDRSDPVAGAGGADPTDGPAERATTTEPGDDGRDADTDADTDSGNGGADAPTG